MGSPPQHLWGRHGSKGSLLSNSGSSEESPYDNAGLNNLSPTTNIFNSIESNDKQPMNIQPDGFVRKKRPMLRRKSLMKYQKNLEPIQQKIHELLDSDVKASKQDNNIQASNNLKRVRRISSQTELKRPVSVDTTKPDTDAELKGQAPYSTRIQEGDNNLMFVCEPKTMKSCCRQVGNNNVMVNLHMSMITNSCQLLQEDGNVFQLDSKGEVWLEIKVRRNKSKDRLSNCSTISSDSNTTTTYKGAHRSSNVEASNGSNASRIPTEHSDRGSSDSGPSLIRGEVIKSLSNLSDATPEMIGRPVEENYLYSRVAERHRSVDEDEEDNVTVYEMDDAIFVHVETPERLSEYANLDESETVKEALGRRKVKEFLQSQADNHDFDVSIFGWEFEREPLYSLPKVSYRCGQEVMDGHVYSKVNDCLVRNPTLPPRPHELKDVHAPDISGALLSPGGGSDGRCESTASEKHVNNALGKMLLAENNTTSPKTPPSVPPKPKQRQPCENGNEPKTPLYTTLSYEEPPPLRRLGPMSPTIHPKPEFPNPPPVPVRPKDTKDSRCACMTRVTEKNMQTEKALSAPWYHGKISNESSKLRLTGMAAGSFLVRDSSDTSGDHKYTLEFVSSNDVRRLKIMKTDNKYHLKESKVSFDSVENLIDEAMKTGIEVRGDRNSRDWRMIRITPVNKTSS